jgi:hypothetical protein
MIDLDTSVVVVLLTPKDRSPLDLDWFARCRDTLISCDWLITETDSAWASSGATMASATRPARKLV